MSAIPPPDFNAPPVQVPPREKQAETSGETAGWRKALAPLAALGFGVWKFLLPAIQLLKGAKFLVTGLSMIVSVWVYAQMHGYPFAIGFVVSILVHEMGHVYFAWREGVPVTAPLFIPGFGALILQKRPAKSAYAEALIGIGGPVFGALAAVACWAIYFITGNDLFLALAFTGFLINLFNMAPVFPLDGGWIMAALSPWVLIGGYVLLITAAVTGFVRNPLIYLIVILAIPHVWSMLKRGTADPHGGVPTTRPQQIGMGVAYVALVGLLAWGMGQTHFSDKRLQERMREPKPLAMSVPLEARAS
ncbi:MAG: site-2 protease family protein [Fimbriimonas sp.]